MKIIQHSLINFLLFSNFFFYETSSLKNKSIKSSKVPPNVWKASNFISEFHKKFVEDVFLKINHPYLTSITDEDIPDINVMNTIASVISSDLMDPPLTTLANETIQNATQGIEETYEGDQKYKANCQKYNYIGSPTVEIVNLTRFDEILLSKNNITKRTALAPCIIVLFYATACPFSAMAAPHFNTLARAFPTVKMIAINTKKHQVINSQFGIVGVPTVLLFHNGRPFLKFNRNHYTLAQFAKFITLATGINADPKLFVASTDFGGPLPGIPKQETDYALPLSWFVIAVWFVKCVLDSRWFQSFNIPLRGRTNDANEPLF